MYLMQQGKEKDTANPTTKSFSAMESMHRRRLEDPDSIIIQHRAECMQRLSIRSNEPWGFRDVWERQQPAYEGHRQIGRAAYMIADAIQLLENGQVKQAHASLICYWRALYQNALDKGNWTIAWELTGLQDPYRREQFGGTAEELSVIAGYTRAVSDLRNRISQGSFTGAEASLEAVVPPQSKPKAKGKAKGSPKKPDKA